MPETDAVRTLRDRLLELEVKAMSCTLQSRLRSWYQGQAYGWIDSAHYFHAITLGTLGTLFDIVVSWTSNQPRSLKEIWP